MNVNKLFRYIWRLNSIVILLACAAGLTFAVFALVMILDQWMNRPKFGVPMNIPDASQLEDDVRLAYFGRIDGTSYVRAELAVYEDRHALSSSGGWREVRNHLFYNLETGDSHWLLPDHKRVILDTQRLQEVPGPPFAGPILGFIYLVVGDDTNGDGTLSEKDGGDLAISDPTGTEYALLAHDVNDINDVISLDSDTAVIFYVSGDTLRTARISIRKQVVVDDTALEPNSPQ